jgi:hypothetical protein
MSIMRGLHVYIALLSSKRKAADNALTAVYHQFQKPAIFAGIDRNYSPRVDGDVVYPSESKHVEANAKTLLAEVLPVLADHYDTQLTQDMGNQLAKADIVVNGKVLMKNVPATYLLFLEKKLIDFNTMISKMPVLPTAEEWITNEISGLHVTKPKQTIKGKKINKPITMSEATDRHPAQVVMGSEDIVEGFWTTQNLSSAFTPVEVTAMKNRVQELLVAVKAAREVANTTAVEFQEKNRVLIDYVFGA